MITKMFKHLQLLRFSHVLFTTTHYITGVEGENQGFKDHMEFVCFCDSHRGLIRG